MTNIKFSNNLPNPSDSFTPHNQFNSSTRFPNAQKEGSKDVSVVALLQTPDFGLSPGSFQPRYFTDRRVKFKYNSCQLKSQHIDITTNLLSGASLFGRRVEWTTNSQF